jgi:hypothetical protein
MFISVATHAGISHMRDFDKKCGRNDKHMRESGNTKNTGKGNE